MVTGVRKFGPALGLIVAAVPGTATADPPSACEADLVYIGTQGSGPEQGVFSACFDPKTGKLRAMGLGAELARPTWLLADPDHPVIWANSDPGNDSPNPPRVVAYRVERGTGALHQISGTATGGKGPTHSAYDPRSHTLFIANYASATAAALPVLSNGSLGDPVSHGSDFGSGPKPRQSAPHAHAVAIDASGRFLLVPDLGADRLFVYRFDPRGRTLSSAEPAFVQFPAGSGPRHVAVHPGGKFIYVITELRPAIEVLRWSARHDRLEPVETVPTMPDDEADRNKGAEIMVSPDGHFLYTSNRGENFILVQTIAPATGKLTEIQRIPSGGQLPWNFVLHRSGRWMLVVNQASGTITAFARDPETGKLTSTDQTIAVAKATSIVFATERRGASTRR